MAESALWCSAADSRSSPLFLPRESLWRPLMPRPPCLEVLAAWPLPPFDAASPPLLTLAEVFSPARVLHPLFPRRARPLETLLFSTSRVADDEDVEEEEEDDDDVFLALSPTTRPFFTEFPDALLALASWSSRWSAFGSHLASVAVSTLAGLWPPSELSAGLTLFLAEDPRLELPRQPLGVILRTLLWWLGLIGRLWADSVSAGGAGGGGLWGSSGAV